jgi:uncharacterized repeat protein (TIGR03803 family)
MKNLMQHFNRYLSIRPIEAAAAMVLVIVFAVAVFAAASAQAQTYNFGVLHSFTNTPDGAYSEAGLVLDAQGNLYGTTTEGGGSGNGTVFELDTTGQQTVLYSFAGGADGAYPGNLVLDAQGNLYGATYEGGDSGYGTVFELDTTGKETVLYSFTGKADGGYPGGVIFDGVGNLYGAASVGGANNVGVVYELNLVPGKWTETVLYNFAGEPDGSFPGGKSGDGLGGQSLRCDRWGRHRALRQWRMWDGI